MSQVLLKLFESLDRSALRRMQFAKNDVIFLQGDTSRGLYFVEKGQVNLQRVTEAGHAVTLHRAMAGGLFAEASLHSDHYHCTAHCLAECVVICIDKQAVLSRLSQDNAFSLAFHKVLAGQIQEYRQLIEILAIKSARDRIMAAVTAGLLQGPVTEFSNTIGLSQEVCYRGLRSLCNEGFLTQTGRGRYVLGPET